MNKDVANCSSKGLRRLVTFQSCNVTNAILNT